MRKKILVSVLSVTALLQACAPIGLAVGAGAVTGTAASREGGIGQAWTDTQIQAYINDAWFRHDTEMFRKLDLIVMEGRVLITGSVQKPEQREAAIRFAWQAQGVRQVINEIRIEPSGGVGGYARDSWIVTQFRTKLIADRDIESINYKFGCDKGKIYLLGVARDQEELDRVIAHARGISYVNEVVSYVRIRGEVRPNESIQQNSVPAR